MTKETMSETQPGTRMAAMARRPEMDRTAAIIKRAETAKMLATARTAPQPTAAVQKIHPETQLATAARRMHRRRAEIRRVSGEQF